MLWHSLVVNPPVPAWTSSGVGSSVIEPGAAVFKTVLIFKSVTAFFFFLSKQSSPDLPVSDAEPSEPWSCRQQCS